MKNFIITYTHSTGEREIQVESPEELLKKLEDLINDKHVIDSSIEVQTCVLAF